MILGLIAHNKLFAGLAECYIHPRLVHVLHAIRQVAHAPVKADGRRVYIQHGQPGPGVLRKFFARKIQQLCANAAAAGVLHVLYKRYQKQTLIIVTKRPEDVYEAIAEITHHDATLIKGEGCYSKQECDVLYSVVGRDEVSKVVNTVRETDPQAFVNMIRTENLAGRFYQRPND